MADKQMSLEEMADLDVFVVDIKMQKNASWQGSLRRVGSRQEVMFRSALEMLKMLDDALDTSAGPIPAKVV